MNGFYSISTIFTPFQINCGTIAYILNYIKEEMVLLIQGRNKLVGSVKLKNLRLFTKWLLNQEHVDNTCIIMHLLDYSLVNLALTCILSTVLLDLTLKLASILIWHIVSVWRIVSNFIASEIGQICFWSGTEKNSLNLYYDTEH